MPFHTDIAGYLAQADAAGPPTDRGAAFEDLAVYLFEALPGSVVVRNVHNPFRSEQIDLAVATGAMAGGLANQTILVECKNWDAPVDSAAVGYFIAECHHRSVPTGVLIAASGITGDPQKRSYAHSLAMGASALGLTVVVVTRTDIEALTSVDEWVSLLINLHLLAKASGGMGCA